MKTAKELKVGDILVAGTMEAKVISVRLAVESNDAAQSCKVNYITVEGQPEIADWNLQEYIDQGSITIKETK